MKIKNIPMYWNTIRFIVNNFASVHYDILKKTPPGRIHQKDFTEIVDPKLEIRLINYLSRDGNVSSFELVVLCHLIAMFQPKAILELGTFDGNTTLQMALNSPENTVIHTLDLPHTTTTAPVEIGDLSYIEDKKKLKRKFLGTSLEKKIRQHLGDSNRIDFQEFGNPDFVFIDASHSYECVKNDSEKTMRVLSPGGVIIWHDFTPNWPGVWLYLSELSKDIPLVQIKNTTLVYYINK
jgi:hypothetical protein